MDEPSTVGRRDVASHPELLLLPRRALERVARQLDREVVDTLDVGLPRLVQHAQLAQQCAREPGVIGAELEDSHAAQTEHPGAGGDQPGSRGGVMADRRLGLEDVSPATVS
jgi:hypothetical protein